MRITTKSCLLSVFLIAILGTAHGDTPAEATENDTAQTQAKPARTPEQITCMTYCDASETKCSSEVRRARAECSKRAANAGRDPFTMRNNDYTYFCGYFGNGRACGSGTYSAACRNRFSRTYGLCVDAIQNNIASMRYDCYQTERTAQNYCRSELRDCKAACQ